MKLLVVTHSTQPLGGTESYLKELLPCLTASGIDVGLAAEIVRPAQLDSVRAPQHDWNWNVEDARSAVKLVEEWSPDVVMQNGVVDPEIEAAFLKARPAVLFAHGYYGTCLSGTKRFASPRLAVCHLPFRPRMSPHSTSRDDAEVSNPLTAARRYSLQRSRLRLLSRYRYIIVASSSDAGEEYLQHEIPASRIKLRAVFCGGRATIARRR